MNWFPVFSALAVVITPFFGIDHPGRVIVTQMVIVLATLVGLAISWRRQGKLSPGSI